MGLPDERYSRSSIGFAMKLGNTFKVILLYGIILNAVHTAKAQLVNTPPVLYMSERNWVISENEQVGQVIARARAEDAEGDNLVFGLEPRFLSRTNDASSLSNGKLPFRIDPVAGVVYLNESIYGRAGENILLYVTVSDGQFSAKNEVFVNILRKDEQKHQNSRNQPSISNIVQNILPSFESLPGVQSIRNTQYSLNRHPTNFPQGFGNNQQNYGILGYKPISNLNVPVFSSDANGFIEDVEDNTQKQPVDEPSSTSRTKLTPIINNQNGTTTGTEKNATNAQESPNKIKELNVKEEISIKSSSLSIKSPLIVVAIGVCALSVAAAIIIVVVYRKNLFAISKTLKKKTKEEMSKKSNQSNVSSTLTDESRNSMVMQHWNGPIAYGNRYVPWERDTQLMQYNMSPSNTGLASRETGISRDFSSSVQPINTTGERKSEPTASSYQTKYDRWEFPRHRLKFFNILGEGAFGQVWRCEATDIEGNEGITTVAVKTLKENAAEVEKKDLISELEVMKSLDPHINVVRFLGCCTEKDPIFVIIEYVNRGKLQTYLRNSRAERHYGNTHGKSNVLTSGDLTSFMYQVAKGMDFLTSRGIIHRDLAARNILISDDHTCKVADFGFARDVVTSKIYERKSEGKLPIRWMAIESLYDNIFSVKSDIWSFGILMWEIVTLGSTPYPGISAADVMRKVRDGYRLEKPEHCRRELYNIMYYCWSKDPNERPTFSEIVEMLDKLLQTEMDYIELERFPDHNYYNILNLSGEKL